MHYFGQTLFNRSCNPERSEARQALLQLTRLLIINITTIRIINNKNIIFFNIINKQYQIITSLD